MADLLAELSARHPEVEIWAAGGVVHRPGREGTEPEILVVHRPHRDDWSLPKGKLDPGETLERAARREVEEETGYRCTLGARLGVVRYPHRGRPKAVVYWLMSPTSGDFAPNPEVDAVDWLPLAEAARRCTYDHDRALLTDQAGRRLDGPG